MFIFGTIGIFRKYISLPSSFIALERGAVGAFFLLWVTVFQRRKLSGEEKKKAQLLSGKTIRKNLFLLVFSGVSMGFNWILLFEAYNYTSVSTATLCYYMAPVFIIIASPFVLKEKLTKRKVFCVIAALAGMALVSGLFSRGNRDAAGSGSVRGILYGLAAALLYCSVVLTNKRMGEIDAYDKTIVQLLSSSAVLLPYVLLTEDCGSLVISPLSWVLLAVVGIVHTGMAYSLYFGALKTVDAQTAAIFSYIDPVVALILSAAILHETMGPPEIAGAVLIIGAALLSERTQHGSDGI